MICKSLLHFSIITLLITTTSICYTQPTNDAFYFNFEQEKHSLSSILSRYIQIASISGSEKNGGEFLQKLCAENGLYIHQMGNKDGNYNFAASMQPLSKKLPNIIFLNHINVTPSGDIDEWTFPPFSGNIAEGDIWGRGAFDNKGAAIMQLASIIEISKIYPKLTAPYNITFLAVSCEETQCEGGVKYVVNNHLDYLTPIVVIGEGSPAINGILKSNPNQYVFGISVAHKRALWLKLELKIETSGHASVPPLQYANKEMIHALNRLVKKPEKVQFNQLNTDLLKQLGQLEKGILSFALQHPNIFKPIIIPQLRLQHELLALFTNTITLTKISSSNKTINTIPHKVTAYLDCRLLPLASQDYFLVQLKKRLRNDSIKITIINEMPEMQASNNDNLFYQNLHHVLSTSYPDSHVTPIFLPNYNDTGIFRSQDIPSYAIMPIKIDRSYLEYIHTHNEQIPINSLQQGKNIYIKFLKKCLENAQ